MSGRHKAGFILVLLFGFFISGIWVKAAGIGPLLTMQSETGDYIGQGLNYSYDTTTGTFSATASAPNGPVDYVTISYYEPSFANWWYLNFSSRQLGTGLEPGVYTNAERAAFATAGHPGLDVFGNGRGCNTLTGTFTIEQASFDYSGNQPRVVSFVATFEQHCEGAPAALFGRIEYPALAYLPVIYK